MPSQQQVSTTPKHLRDRLGTPDFVAAWARNSLLNFTFDLAAEPFTAKAGDFFNKEDDALKQDWHKLNAFGWCNPPYSEPGKWLEKAWQEAQKGFVSIFYVPTPNGEESYRDYVFGKASEIVFINGRINHIAPEDYIKVDKHGNETLVKKGDEIKGNTRGNCFVIYTRKQQGFTRISWVDRQEMIDWYERESTPSEKG